MREYLKTLGLDGEVIDKIMAGHGKRIGVLNEQIGALNEKVKATASELQKYDGVDIAGLNSEIEKLKADAEKATKSHAKELRDIKFSNALENAIRKENPIDDIAYRAHLDVSKLDIDEDGNLTGFDEQSAAIKENYGYMFKEATVYSGGDDHGSFDGGSNAGGDLLSAINDYYEGK